MQNNNDQAEQLSAYLDGELTAQDIDNVRSQIESDPDLEREFRMVSAVRQTVRGRSQSLRQAMPIELERSIRLALAKEVEVAGAPSESFLDRILTTLRRPAFALSAATVALVAVVVLTLDRNQAGTPASTAVMSASVVNLYDASYENFEKVVNGDIQLAKSSSDPAELASFFESEGVQYSVFFPEIAAELKGGVVSEHQGRKFAHLVYGIGDHLVYIFEVDEASVANNSVAMNTAVAQDLASSRWHWEERSNVGTMFVWESNNVICSAVSDLHTQDLSALFTLESL